MRKYIVCVSYCFMFDGRDYYREFAVEANNKREAKDEGYREIFKRCPKAIVNLVTVYERR